MRQDCAVNARSRILFETDVRNDYFAREEYPGFLDVQAKFSATQTGSLTYNLNLHDGLATLNLEWVVCTSLPATPYLVVG